jgi:hypothetical protein
MQRSDIEIFYIPQSGELFFKIEYNTLTHKKVEAGIQKQTNKRSGVLASIRAYLY